jgi:hypothetical protein
MALKPTAFSEGMRGAVHRRRYVKAHEAMPSWVGFGVPIAPNHARFVAAPQSQFRLGLFIVGEMGRAIEATIPE